MSLATELAANGWVIVRGAADPARIAQFRADLADDIAGTPFSEGLFYGARTQRFGRLLARSPIAADLVLDPVAHGAAQDVIAAGYPHVGLNLTQLIAVHPGAGAQVPHRDDEMWPIPAPVGEHLLNVLWPLTRFRAENGATLVWSGSHRGAPGPVADAPVAAEMDPGDALMMLGSTLHAQGANRSDEVRSCAVIGYHAAWLLPIENPWLSYPPDMVAGWPVELRQLVGYRRLPPNLNGVDCRCPAEMFDADIGVRGHGAVDTLWPHQEEGLRRFHALAG